MYKLVRKRDNLTFIMDNYQNIRYKMDGNSLSDFPPEVGCGVFIYNDMIDNWRTTLIKSTKKIGDKKYIFKTKNSEYTIEKDFRIK